MADRHRLARGLKRKENLGIDLKTSALRPPTGLNEAVGGALSERRDETRIPSGTTKLLWHDYRTATHLACCLPFILIFVVLHITAVRDKT